MPYAFSITEADYQANYPELLTALPGLGNYLADHVSYQEGKVTINMPASVYKSISSAFKKKPGLLTNPIVEKWCYEAEEINLEGESLTEQLPSLLQQADDYASKLPEHQPIPLGLLSDINSVNFDELFAALLQRTNARSLIVGESHGGFASLMLILKNVETLQQTDALVVVENLCDSVQDELDRCYEQGQLSPLAALVTPVIKLQGNEAAGRLKKHVLHTLLQHGVRIVAGDNEVSNAIDERYPAERLKAMNYVAVANVEKYKEKHGISADAPVIYLTGQAHDFVRNNYPGLVELTNGVCIQTEDDKHLKNRNHAIELNSKKGNARVVVKVVPEFGLNYVAGLPSVQEVGTIGSQAQNPEPPIASSAATSYLQAQFGNPFAFFPSNSQSEDGAQEQDLPEPFSFDADASSDSDPQYGAK